MYELKELVNDLFSQYNESLFEMELGQVAYKLLDKDINFKIPVQMKRFDNLQRLEILRTMIQNLPIEPLIRYEFSSRQMAEIRKFLEEGIDVCVICNPMISHNSMALIRNSILKSIQIPDIDITQYDYVQLKQIMFAVEQELDYTQLLDNTKSEVELREIRNTLARERDLEAISADKYRRIHLSVFGGK